MKYTPTILLIILYACSQQNNKGVLIQNNVENHKDTTSVLLNYKSVTPSDFSPNMILFDGKKGYYLLFSGNDRISFLPSGTSTSGNKDSIQKEEPHNFRK